MTPMARPGRHPARRWARVAGHVVLAWFTLVTCFAGWRFADVPDGSPPWAGPSSFDVAERPLIPAVVLLAIALAVAVGLSGWRPRAAHALALAAGAGYAALGGFSFALVLPWAVTSAHLLVALGVRRGWPWLVPVPFAYLASAWAQPGGTPGDPRTWGAVFALVTWTLLPSLVALIRDARREAGVRAREEELREAASAERLRVARDIHDVVGHSLSMISLQSGVALRVLDGDPAQARASLAAIRTSAVEALDELRRTLGVFRDTEAALAPTPGLTDLPGLVDQARAGGVGVDLTLPNPDAIPRATQAVAYRVVQEALTNAIRHAPGQTVTLAITRDGQGITVRASNPGPTTGQFAEGTGLRGMRERVAALGGTLQVGPGPDGWSVTAHLPLSPIPDSPAPVSAVRAELPTDRPSDRAGVDREAP